MQPDRPLAFLALTALSLTAMASAAARADCTWRIGGKVAVNATEIELGATARALEGVTIQVAATNLSWGPFTTWDTVESGHDGRFEVVKTKSCAKRRFRVWMKLDSADLQVKNGDGGEWVLLRDDGSGTWTLWQSKTELGAWTFAHGAAGALGDRMKVRRATTWYMATRLMDWLESRDPWLGFGRKLHVKYPANVLSGVSWAAIDTVYIHSDDKSDQWNPWTLMHEIMHIWNYDHNSGVTNWLAGVLWDFNTHGHQEEPAIAFHEGFAEFAAEQLLFELFPSTYPQPTTSAPGGFASLDQIQRNDIAVASALTMAQGWLIPTVDMFLCFRGNADRGWPKDLELGGTSKGLLMYLERCRDIMESFTPAEYETLLATIDPALGP